MDCLFCKIAAGDIPSTKVYEDEYVYAFYDIAPQAKIHVVTIPKEHIAARVDDINESNSHVIAKLFEALPKVAAAAGIEGGYRVVTNCGDDRVKALVFNNVVTTGRLNPSNNGGERVVMDGFVAAEIHDAKGLNPTAGTVSAICNLPMTWQSLDLGIDENVLNITVTAYNASAGELTDCATYNVVNNGASTEGIENAYLLPMLTGATIYADDAVKVNWLGLGENANAKTEYYVPGTPYVTINPFTAPAYAMNATKLVHDGTWVGAPAHDTVMTADVNVTPGYTVEANVSGFKTNLSLYSDFLVNLYIPAALGQYVTAVNGVALPESTVTIGEAEFYRVIVAKKANEVSTDAVFEIALKEGEYVAAKTVKVNILDYATNILNGEYDLEIQSLIAYMLHYAYRAEFYFNGSSSAKLENLIFNEASIGSGGLEDYACENAIENTGLDPIFSSASVQLNETPAFVFTPNGKFAGTVTITYGDSVRTYTVLEGSTTKIVVEDMKIYNFAKTLTITAVGTVIGEEGEQTITGSFNLDTYTKYHIENSTNSESATQSESQRAIHLIKALYNYVKSAESYKA